MFHLLLAQVADSLVDTVATLPSVTPAITLGAVMTYLFGSGLVSAAVMQGLKHLSGMIDSLPALAKQFVVFAIAMAITGVADYFNLSLPGDLSGWTVNTVVSLATTLVAFGYHSIKKAVQSDVQLTSNGAVQ